MLGFFLAIPNTSFSTTLSIKQWVPLKVAFVTLPFKLTATLVALE